MAKRGHEQPELDYGTDGEENLFSQLSLEQTTPAQDDLSIARATPPIEGERKPVAEIMAEHDARIEERAAKWEELSEANWPESRIQQALDALFPDLRDSDRVEELEDGQLADRRRQARKSVQPKRHRSPAQNPGIRRLPGYDKVIPPEAR